MRNGNSSCRSLIRAIYFCFASFVTSFKHLIDAHKCEGFPCAQCPKKYKEARSLARHVEEKHNAANKVSCEVCSKEFPAQRYLKDHLKSAHTGEYFVCNVCGVQCKWKSSMNKHMRRAHPKWLVWNMELL